MKSLTLIPPASAGIRRLKAKTVSLAVTKRKLFFILSFLFMVTGFFAKGQTPFFSPQNISPEALNPEQRVIYDKAVNFGTYTDFQIGHVNPISTCLYSDSFLNVEANGLACYNTAHFVTRNIEYKADNDFYWYGQFVYPDSASSCFKGEAMFFTDTGKYYGYFIVNNQNYELIDLTGGLQVLAQVDMSKVNLTTCGSSSELAKTTGNSSTNTDGVGGYQCKPKVLVLFTQDALSSDPMGWGRGTLAFNQTRQALLNSGVTLFQMGLMYKADVVNYTTPAFYNGQGTGIKQVLADMKSPNSPLSYDISYKRFINHADMVILITKAIYAEYISGEALIAADPPILGPNDYPYAAVQINYATTAGYTFAHELGHIMGGRHANEGPTPPADYTPGLGHAHKWEYAVYNGWFKIKSYKPGYTIGYQSTATFDEVILQYSNPNLYDHGQLTGRNGDRNAAQLYRQNGCAIANFDSDPDEFTIGVSASVNNPRSYNGQFANGKYHFCSQNQINFLSWVTGPQGSYSYAWEVSYNGGLNWYPYSNNINFNLYFSLSPADPFVDINVRLTITSPSGTTRVEYYPMRILNCPLLGIPYKLAASSSPNILQPETSLNEQLFSNSFTVSPNPAINILTVEIGLSQETPIQLILVDMLGRQILLPNNSILAKGVHRISLDVSDVPVGIYQIIYQHGGEREIQKLSIVR